MTRLFLVDPPEPGPAWAPFAGVRPLSELRAGAWLLRERWEAAIGRAASGLVAAHAEGFCDVDHPPAVSADQVTGPALVASATCVPAREPVRPGPGVRRLTVEDRTVAWVLAEGERWHGPHEEGPAQAIGGRTLSGAWELVDLLETLLPADCLEFTAAPADPLPSGAVVLGDPGRVVCLGAAVEPGVVFDVREGAVVLAEGAEVRAGARLTGPLFVGPGTVLLGGRIGRSSLGPACRVHGEVSDVVMTGYANKSHDGFVGHSVLGAWVNLGAGTITSNLKNTYGAVALDLPGGRLETGRQFLGSLIGDHAKTAIGTLFGTGTVVGAGASLFGERDVPRYVPPFAWGPGPERMALEGFLRMAGRVLPRRGVAFTPERERALRALHARHVR